MARSTTLLDLVTAVSQHASSETELVATVAYLVNSGRFHLCGTFRGAHFDLAGLQEDRAQNQCAAFRSERCRAAIETAATGDM